MPLFEMPKRKAGKDVDAEVLKRAKKTSVVPTTIKGGSNLMDRISSAQKLVESKLGYLTDKYILIQDTKTLEEYINVCVKNNVIAIDTETTGLDPLQDQIAGICIYTPDMPGAYIPINHVSYITSMIVPGQLNVEEVRSYFETLMVSHPDIIMFNAKFDIRVLRNKVGLKNIYCTWDCYLASRLLNENEEHRNLKYLHQKYVLEDKEDAFTFGELFNGIPFTRVPLKTALLYAAHDPEITYELYDYQRQYLKEDSDRQDMRDIYWVFKNIEMPCVNVICDMEDNGILFDMEYQEVLSKKYNELLVEKQAHFHELVAQYSKEIQYYKEHNPNHKLDHPINISSPTQIATLFYDIIGYEAVDKKNPRGTGVDILTKLQDPIANAILEYREVQKLISTYIDKLPNCVNPTDGRIHCSFNQYGADTGRMSSSDPNLQNIPSHNKDIRKMFVASPGYVLMSSDFSQQEPKCLAALCRKQGDDQMYQTFMAGKDLYSEIASKAFNKPYEECREFNPDGTTNKAGKERRTQAKSILLGVLYGRGVKSIAEQLKCTPEKAQQIKDSVFKGFPAIEKFEKDSLQMAKDIGYVTTVCGRKRRLPDLQLDEYEFEWVNGMAPDNDLLDFDNEDGQQDVPEQIIGQYLYQLNHCNFRQKPTIKEQAKREGILIIDNGGKIADATRQAVNARIQGSAADLTKLAMVELNNNKQLKELGFRLLIPVHDEVIAECPAENVEECAKLLAETMSKAAEEILEMPIKCDVSITRCWYGEEIQI